MPRYTPAIFDVERNLTPGEGFSTVALDTACGEVQVGAMICFDREFPESARILMLQGAELILVPNACPMEINRLSQLRARAFENMLAIATCNYPEGVPDCNGGSSVFDGVAYLPELEGSRDTCILQAGRHGRDLCGRTKAGTASPLPGDGSPWQCLPASEEIRPPDGDGHPSAICPRGLPGMSGAYQRFPPSGLTLKR